MALGRVWRLESADWGKHARNSLPGTSNATLGLRGGSKGPVFAAGPTPRPNAVWNMLGDWRAEVKGFLTNNLGHRACLSCRFQYRQVIVDRIYRIHRIGRAKAPESCSCCQSCLCQPLSDRIYRIHRIGRAKAPESCSSCESCRPYFMTKLKGLAVYQCPILFILSILSMPTSFRQDLQDSQDWQDAGVPILFIL